MRRRPLEWSGWLICWIAATQFQRRHYGRLTLVLSAILGTLLFVACGDPPRPAKTTTERTPTVLQVGLRPRSSTTMATTAQATKPAAMVGSTPGIVAAESAPGFVRVAVGEDHACALQASGRIQCWGANDDGQLDAPEDVEFQEVTAGYRFTCGIRTDGGISCWGQNDHAQLDAPQGQFTAIDAGWDHVCALSGGTATCWGWNANERATPPTDVEFTAIGAGAEHSCGLTAAQDLQCWGENDDGRATSRVGPFSVLAVGIAHTCVLSLSGKAQCHGDNSASQTDAPEIQFSNISAGADHTCGLDLSGSLKCWGGTVATLSMPDSPLRPRSFNRSAPAGSAHAHSTKTDRPSAGTILVQPFQVPLLIA